MKKLFIIGAGGFGRELHSWIGMSPLHNKEWRFEAFLDDNIEALKEFGNFARVESIATHTVSSQNVYLCGMGSPKSKMKTVKHFLENKAQFISFIHPRATIGERVKLGQGVVICPESVLSCDIVLGDFVMVNIRSTIGHDAQVGSWSTLSAQCDLTGGTELGIGVFLGSRATVIPGKKVGNHSTVGAGAVVMSNIPDNVTVVGNPARVL